MCVCINDMRSASSCNFFFCPTERLSPVYYTGVDCIMKRNARMMMMMMSESMVIFLTNEKGVLANIGVLTTENDGLLDIYFDE